MPDLRLQRVLEPVLDSAAGGSRAEKERQERFPSSADPRHWVPAVWVKTWRRRGQGRGAQEVGASGNEERGGALFPTQASGCSVLFCTFICLLGR